MQTLLTALPPVALATADPLVGQWAEMAVYQSDQWTSNDGEVAQARASHAWLRDPDRMNRLVGIEVPVQIVAFEFDPLLGPTQAGEAAARIRNSELCVIEGASHGGVMTHAQELISRTTAFLTKHHQ